MGNELHSEEGQVVDSNGRKVDVSAFSDTSHRTSNNFGDWAQQADITPYPGTWARMSLVNGGLGVAAGAPVQSDTTYNGRAQLSKRFPASWAGTDYKVTVLHRGGNSYAAAVAAMLNTLADTIGGYAGAYETVLAAWTITQIGATTSQYIYLDAVPDAAYVTDQVYEVSMFVSGGNVYLYVDGVRKAGPVPIDATHLLSPLHGVHIQTQNGFADVAYDTVIVEGLPDVRPLTAAEISALAVMTRPAVVGTTATTQVTSNEASSTAVDLTYPTTVNSGELLVAVVAYNTGTFTVAPTGWTLRVGGGTAGGIRIALFTKVSDGTETGTVTFTKTTGGASVIGGVMFRMTGCNTTAPMSGAAQGNTSSTNMASASQTVRGYKKKGLWAGASAQNQTITMPSGFSEIVKTGTAGQALNLSVGLMDYDVSPAASVAGPTGTIAVAGTSATIHGFFQPKPS